MEWSSFSVQFGSGSVKGGVVPGHDCVELRFVVAALRWDIEFRLQCDGWRGFVNMDWNTTNVEGGQRMMIVMIGEQLVP